MGIIFSFILSLIWGFMLSWHLGFPSPVFQGAWGLIGNRYTEGTMFFAGDIMLGRKVETWGREHGSDYFFDAMRSHISESNVSIGNFEGAIPEIHTQTPELTFLFSIDKPFMQTLSQVGFDVLSLANNHSLDYGNEGFFNTKLVCAEVAMRCQGHPFNEVPFIIETVQVGSTDVGLVFLHTLFASPDEAVLTRELQALEKATDIQIVYVHWGTEYEAVHSVEQEALAHFLIDSGVDAVIGHHPHVVQDIEVYKEKAIFYSLGNFVFDQYFSEIVQKGLALVLTLKEENINFTLIPVTSIEKKGQPNPMSRAEGLVFVQSFVPDDLLHVDDVGRMHFSTKR